MRIRAFSLTLALVLAACQNDPTAPDAAPSLNGALIGTGSRTDSVQASSGYIGTGGRDGTADGPYVGGGSSYAGTADGTGWMGGGTLAGAAPAGTNAIGTSLSGYGGSSTLGSGPRDGEDEASTAGSSLIGGGTREEEETQDSPFMGGSGGD